MSPRRTPGGPGSRRPGERSARPRATLTPTPAAPEATHRRRPRFTGRAAVLVLVVALLTVSYASSMRAYLQQRSHIADLKAQIAEREANIDALEREKRRWHDPAYVQTQARKRFGYLMPGETAYVVLDEQGRPLESGAELPEPSDALQAAPEAWWGTAWQSVELAGNPPKHARPPATDIDAPEVAKQ